MPSLLANEWLGLLRQDAEVTAQAIVRRQVMELMMFLNLHETVECSKCKSTAFERVDVGNSRFLRCRGCGHEGPKSDIIPRMTSSEDGALARYAREQRETPQTF